MNAAILVLLVIIFLVIIIAAFWYFNPSKNISTTQKSPTVSYVTPVVNYSQISAVSPIVSDQQTEFGEEDFFHRKRNTLDLDESLSSISEGGEDDYSFGDDATDHSQIRETNIKFGKERHQERSEPHFNISKHRDGKRSSGFDISHGTVANNNDRFDISRQTGENNDNDEFDISRGLRGNKGEGKFGVSRETVRNSDNGEFDISRQTGGNNTGGKFGVSRETVRNNDGNEFDISHGSRGNNTGGKFGVSREAARNNGNNKFDISRGAGGNENVLKASQPTGVTNDNIAGNIMQENETDIESGMCNFEISKYVTTPENNPSPVPKQQAKPALSQPPVSTKQTNLFEQPNFELSDRESIEPIDRNIERLHKHIRKLEIWIF